MSIKTILSFDPGLGNLGYSVIQDIGGEFVYIKSGVYKQKGVKSDIGRKLLNSYEFIVELMLTYKPDYVAYEKMFFRGRSDSAASTIKVIGLIQAISTDFSVEDILEISPPTLKKFITGSGRADKKEVKKHTVEKMLKLETKTTMPKSNQSNDHLGISQILKAPHHQIDACAIGLWAFDQLKGK